FEQRDAAAQALLVVGDLAAHRGLGDRRDLGALAGDLRDLVDALDGDQRRVHVEGDQAEVGQAQRRHDTANDETGRGACRAAHAASRSFGVPSARSTSRTSWTRSFTCGASRSMRNRSLPTSLMWRFFCTSSMMRRASIGGSGTKVIAVALSPASIF